MKKIWWIGTGVMGHAMVQHIMNAWYEVYVYNRTKSKTDNLVDLWAQYCESIWDLAQKSDIIFTIIWDPKSVEETYFWEDWVLKNAKSGSILIDMTTTTPSLSKKIFDAAQIEWCSSLDAPVSWGDTWAINGTLSIMVGGEKKVYNETKILFDLMWKSVTYIWSAGKWQDTKMANQIAIAGNTIWMTESLLYAEKAGLDLETTIGVLCAWWACSWWYINLAPRIIRKDFETYFFIKHFVKDMWIAIEECKYMNINLPWLNLVNDLYKNMVKYWEWDLWMQSLIIELKRLNNISLDS